MSAGSQFIEGLEKGQLTLQRCTQCGRVQTGIRARCCNCSSDDLVWSAASAQGVVYAVTTVARAPTEALRDITPYALCLVDLEQGGRLMGHCPPETRIGTHVHGGIRRIAGRLLPFFEPVREKERGVA